VGVTGGPWRATEASRLGLKRYRLERYGINVWHVRLLLRDTPFNACAGNCHNGGHPTELKTFSERLAKLPPPTLIYPGHDYIENNLRFTLSREPDNKTAREMLDKLAGQDPNGAYVSKSRSGSTRSFD
jgi:hypothetical protein